MDKIALLFSGQGSQSTGMGRELIEYSPAASRVFETMAEVRADIYDICFNIPQAELNLTVNSQPALYCVGLGWGRALQEAGITAAVTAGFSLGEISALAYSEILSDKRGAELVNERAKAMHAAALKNNGAMMAVIGLSQADVEETAREAGAYCVNYNSPSQFVISGPEKAVEKAGEIIKSGGGRGIKLAVSGAFHSPLMNEASGEIKKYLQNVDVKPPVIPIYSNVTGEQYGGDMKNLIALQINSPVQWTKTITNIYNSGITTFVEVGAGKVLTGLVNKIAPEAKAINITDIKSLKEYINA